MRRSVKPRGSAGPNGPALSLALPKGRPVPLSSGRDTKASAPTVLRRNGRNDVCTNNNQLDLQRIFGIRHIQELAAD
ncbi:unnamed protein product, partial [Iphiclides podalirius]